MSELHYLTNIANRSIQIVVVEDEEKLLGNIVDYLKLNSFNVEGFSNPAAALSYLQSNTVDVVVSDVKMPQINGFDLISEVRSSNKNADTVFIFLTAKIDKDDMRQGMNLQADDYLTKPFIMADLINSINTRLQLRQNRRQKDDTKNFAQKHILNSSLDKLTKAEVNIMYMVSQGKTNDEIANYLSLSPKTIDNHRTNISTKLAISGRNKLINFCIENKQLIQAYIQEKMRDKPHAS